MRFLLFLVHVLAILGDSYCSLYVETIIIRAVLGAREVQREDRDCTKIGTLPLPFSSNHLLSIPSNRTLERVAPEPPQPQSIPGRGRTVDGVAGAGGARNASAGNVVVP